MDPQHDHVTAPEDDRAVHVDAVIHRLGEREPCSRASCTDSELSSVWSPICVPSGRSTAKRPSWPDGVSSTASVSTLGSRIDGEDGRERGLVLLGVGDGPVAGHVADEEREREGERRHQQGRDGQRDEEEAAPHRWAAAQAPGRSSLMPTPRTVWR